MTDNDPQTRGTGTEPETAIEWKVRGNELFSQDDIDGALVAYTKAIELEPENAVYYSNRAAAYTFKRDYAKGVDDAKKAIKLNHGYPKAWIRLGVAEYSRGDYSEALTAFKEAKKHASEDTVQDKKIRVECDEHMALCEAELAKIPEIREKIHSDERLTHPARITDGEEKEMLPDGDAPMSPHKGKEIEFEDTSSPPCCSKEWFKLKFNIGTIANLCSFTVTIIGFVLKYSGNEKQEDSDCGYESCAFVYPLTSGMFAVGGGVTNWVAIKMLFDKIPGVYGSGIIPGRFKEIRLVVKNVIMKNFFDETFLNFYLKDKILNMDIEGKLTDLVKSDKMDKLLANVFGGDGGILIPIVKPHIAKVAGRVAPLIKDKIRTMDLMHDLEGVKVQVDAMLTERMLELTPEKVKILLEEIMREHLYWLIVWGNIFGAILGIICSAAGLP